MRAIINIIVLIVFVMSVGTSFPLKKMVLADSHECYIASGNTAILDDEIKMRMYTKNENGCCGFHVINNQIEKDCDG